MIEFLIGRALHLSFDARVPRNHGVALVKSLCRNFAGVINSHESSRVCFLFRVEIRINNVFRRIGTCRAPRGGGDRP